MAASTGHVRSTSLPSNTHPVVECVEEQLSRLKSSQQTSSSSITHRLGDLKELYERVDGLIHLPLMKQSLCSNEHLLEDILDGSVRLLDVCGTVRDVLCRMRDCLQVLESSLRRRNGGEGGLASEVRAFRVTKKELNKMIRHCCKNLKGNSKPTGFDKDSEMAAVVSMLREAEEISLAVFNSLSYFLSLSKPMRWRNPLWRLLYSKREELFQQVEAMEADKIDAELTLMKSTKDINLVHVQKILKGLEAFQSTIKETEDELECVFRRLVKTRVSFLNLLNH